MKKLSMLLSSFIFLSSCANHEYLKSQDDAMKDMMISKNKYNNCLIKNSSNPSMCDGLKDAYLANTRALNILWGRSNYSDNSVEIIR